MRFGFVVKHAKSFMVQLGCFWGTDKEAITAVAKKYGARSTYVAQIKLAVKILGEQK
jgi:BRCT domain type II-containing protein